MGRNGCFKMALTREIQALVMKNDHGLPFMINIVDVVK
jgi:hypothetical protein